MVKHRAGYNIAFLFRNGKSSINYKDRIKIAN